MIHIHDITKNTVYDHLLQDGWFGDVRNVSTDIGWNEFLLEDLDIDFDEVKRSVFQTESQVGLKGWRTRGAEVKDYTGFSITTNKNYVGDSPTLWHQTLGDKKTSDTYSASRGSENFESKRNTYYDTYAFNEVHPNFKWLTDKFTGSVLRSRCSYAWSQHMNFPYTGGWHIDEHPWCLLRFVIPITTAPNWWIEFEDNRYNLEVGKGYVWNNRIPHRVAPSHPGNDPRINLIIGFSPWFYFEEGCFLKNEVYGMDLVEMIKEKKFLIDFV